MDILFGFLLPPIIEIVNKDVQNETERYIIAYILCIFLACIVDYRAIFSANLNNLLATVGIVCTESNVMFQLYWKNSLVRVKLQTKLQTANATS